MRTVGPISCFDWRCFGCPFAVLGNLYTISTSRQDVDVPVVVHTSGLWSRQSVLDKVLTCPLFLRQVPFLDKAVVCPLFFTTTETGTHSATVQKTRTPQRSSWGGSWHARCFSTTGAGLVSASAEYSGGSAVAVLPRWSMSLLLQFIDKVWTSL